MSNHNEKSSSSSSNCPHANNGGGCPVASKIDEIDPLNAVN